MDISSKEILEQALNHYEGTVLFVSHDRYFINRTATRILDLTGQALVNYLGNYDYYLEKCRELTEVYAPNAQGQCREGKESSNKAGWKQKKEEQARQRKLESGRKRTEEAIEAAEERLAEIEGLFQDSGIATDPIKLQELQQEYEALQADRDALYEKWETLME